MNCDFFVLFLVKAITKPITSEIELKRKETRVILGGKENWKNAATTSGGKNKSSHKRNNISLFLVRCDKCQNTTAYYRQIQIRSADEPMTTFYRCTKCSYEWKED